MRANCSAKEGREEIAQRSRYHAGKESRNDIIANVTLFGRSKRDENFFFSPRGGGVKASFRAGVAYVSARRGSEPWGKNIHIYVCIYIDSPVGNAGSDS